MQVEKFYCLLIKICLTVNGELYEAGYNAEVKRQQENNKELIEMFKTDKESINNVLKENIPKL